MSPMLITRYSGPVPAGDSDYTRDPEIWSQGSSLFRLFNDPQRERNQDRVRRAWDLVET